MRKYKRLVATITALLVVIVCGSFSAEAVTEHSPPKGCGTLHTYTVWDGIKWGGDCGRLKNFAINNNAISDSYGIVTYGSYFCGALTSAYGKIGDMMLVVEEDNIVYPVIMADTKNQNDSGCNMWGHHYGKCIVEFEVLSSCLSSLYGTSGGYVSDILAKPIVKVVNLGSVFDDTDYFNNPEQACLDNGLEGCTLLVNPYEGYVVQKSEPVATATSEPPPEPMPKMITSAITSASVKNEYNFDWLFNGLNAIVNN